MRIRDWSSDVCSSDLAVLGGQVCGDLGPGEALRAGELEGQGVDDLLAEPAVAFQRAAALLQLAVAHQGDGELVGQQLVVGEAPRSEEHKSELQSLMRISYAVFCLKKQKHKTEHNTRNQHYN